MNVLLLVTWIANSGLSGYQVDFDDMKSMRCRAHRFAARSSEDGGWYDNPTRLPGNPSFRSLHYQVVSRSS